MITAAQVANATRGELLKITYQLLLDSMENVKAYGNVGNIKELEVEIQYSKRILQELIDSLDFKEEVAKNLMQIYVYINGLMMKASISYNEGIINEAIKLINTLLEGWNEAIGNDKEANRVMNNTQQVYAGFTYGKGDLNESILDNDNRGFKA